MRYLLQCLFWGTLLSTVIIIGGLFGSSINNGFPIDFPTFQAWLEANNTSGPKALIIIWLTGPAMGFMFWLYIMSLEAQIKLLRLEHEAYMASINRD